MDLAGSILSPQQKYLIEIEKTMRVSGLHSSIFFRDQIDEDIGDRSKACKMAVRLVMVRVQK
jgi:hypothetical protein